MFFYFSIYVVAATIEVEILLLALKQKIATDSVLAAHFFY
jgi:hypothetical protein